MDQHQHIVLFLFGISVRQIDIEVLRDLFIPLIVQLLGIGLFLYRTGMLAFPVEFRRQKPVVKYRLGAAFTFSMEEAVRNLESADGTLLRDRIMVCMTADLSADGADAFTEIMGARCPANGTHPKVISRVVAAQPAGSARCVFPYMFTRKSAQGTSAVLPHVMPAEESAGGTDAVLPDPVSAEPLMRPGDQAEVNDSEAAGQQQEHHRKQENDPFSSGTLHGSHSARFKKGRSAAPSAARSSVITPGTKSIGDTK